MEQLALRGVESYREALDTAKRDLRLEGFHRSERFFAAAVAGGARTADLYANLGNAALQGERLGDAVLAYGILGGMPAYLRRFDGRVSLTDNLLREVLRPEGYLFDEVQFLLRTELQNPTTYNSILGAVAAGSQRLGDIALAVGVDSPTANKYLHVLRELRIVEREGNPLVLLPLAGVHLFPHASHPSLDRTSRAASTPPGRWGTPESSSPISTPHSVPATISALMSPM